MALSKDVGGLRRRLASPGEELYQHLTDLMEALEEATEESGTSPGGSLPQLDPSGPPGPSHPSPMDTTPSKRRLKRRRSLRTFSESHVGSSVERLTKSRRGDSSWRLHSDSSPPPGVRLTRSARLAATTPEGTVDPGSDSDSAARPSTRKSPLKGAALWAASQRSALRKAALPLPFLVESDSFTETISGLQRQNRRKRLVKKMAVDEPTTSAALEAAVFQAPLLSRQRRSAERRASPAPAKAPSCPAVAAAAAAAAMDCEGGESGDSYSESEDSEPNSESRNGDDEQSDYFLEPGSVASPAQGPAEPSCMGIPMGSSRSLRCAPSPEGLGGRGVESSDTDVSQSSWPAQLSFSVAAGSSGSPGRASAVPAQALNRRLLAFLANPAQTQLRISQLRKKERQQLCRLATFHRLSVRPEVKRRRSCLLISKTDLTVLPPQHGTAASLPDA